MNRPRPTHRRNNQSSTPLPSTTSIETLSKLLLHQADQKKKEQTYAKVKNILSLLSTGVAISATVLTPKSARLLKPLLQKSHNWDTWKHYNISYLKRTLHNLQKQKLVEVEGDSVVLTGKGERKILKYSIDNLSIETPRMWDGKWRLVLYDIPKHDKRLGDLMRQALKTLGFYAIQKSVYVYPYPCFNHIEFLREYYGLGNTIQYMLVTKIENDGAYKTYFALS